MTYEKNIGFQEMVIFTQKATDAEQAEMDRVVAKEDWEAYKNLVSRVLGTMLK